MDDSINIEGDSVAQRNHYLALLRARLSAENPRPATFIAPAGDANPHSTPRHHRRHNPHNTHASPNSWMKANDLPDAQPHADNQDTTSDGLSQAPPDPGTGTTHQSSDNDSATASHRRTQQLIQQVNQANDPAPAAPQTQSSASASASEGQHENSHGDVSAPPPRPAPDAADDIATEYPSSDFPSVPSSSNNPFSNPMPPSPSDPPDATNSSAPSIALTEAAATLTRASQAILKTFDHPKEIAILSD